MSIGADKFSGGSYSIRVGLALVDGRPVEDVVLSVSDGRITGVAPAAGYLARAAGARPVDCSDMLAIPGIVDTHHHVVEPFVKALACGEPAQMWRRIWLPLEASLTVEGAYLGAKWTFLEALRGGVTTIVDHGIRSRDIANAIHRAAEDTGIRLVSSTGAYDLKAYDTAANVPDHSATIDKALALADAHLEECATFPRVYPSLACGTVQSNSPEMIRALQAYCREKGILFQIHANEHTLEVHACIERTGRRPIELLGDLGALGKETLIAHATLVTPHEVDLLRQTDTAVAYNPVASAWKGNAVAPALSYLEAGIRVGLGSDATRNDGFRMIDAAETCQRIAHGMGSDDFSCGAGWRWLDAATRGGARAALLDAEIGNLKVGLRADFLLLDRTGPEVNPSWDLPWELVRYYDRADIRAVFVDGEIVVLEGKPLRFDGELFVRQTAAYGRKSVSEAKIVKLHQPSVLHRR